ncbi:MAG: HIT family protein [Glaciimonas sp.]|nr:HIT family protein [Glaciimonas sp.]
MRIDCELCSLQGGEVVHVATHWHVVLVDDAGYPGFCRVIWNGHVQEMTDLSLAERNSLMAAVWQVEAAVRDVMQPHKINLASLGNMVPHVHWHVIPRFEDDAQFPAPVWAQAQRATAPEILVQRTDLLPTLRTAIRARLASLI